MIGGFAGAVKTVDGVSGTAGGQGAGRPAARQLLVAPEVSPAM